MLHKWPLFRRRGGFLLDLYPNAAVAYSFRKLRTAYAGSAVRIRESGGDTEADIGFDASGNFDTAAAAAHIGANSGFIVTWYDQSGNGLDVTQGTAANQPTYVASGIGSLPTLAPDGGDTLQRAAFDITSYISTNGTVFSVFNQTGTKANNTSFSWQTPDPTNRFVAHLSYADSLYFDLGDATSGSGRVSVVQPSGWDDNPHIAECYRDSSDNQGITIDGTNLVQTAAVGKDITTGSAVWTLFAFGGTDFFQGQCSELVIWGTDLG